MLGIVYTESCLEYVITDAYVIFWCTQIDYHFLQMLL